MFVAFFKCFNKKQTNTQTQLLLLYVQNILYILYAAQDDSSLLSAAQVSQEVGHPWPEACKHYWSMQKRTVKREDGINATDIDG